MGKQCFICGKVKPIDSFYKHAKMADGHLNKCKDCTKEYMRQRQKSGKTKAIDLKRYRENPDRYLKHAYYSIKTRCTMKYRSDGRKNSYYGRPFMSQDEWQEWCEQSKKSFLSLWCQWKEYGYSRKYAPSIDRIDNDKGYVVGNLQWITNIGNQNKYFNQKYGGNREEK